MKRVHALLLALLLTFTLCISGCSKANAESQATAEPTKEVIELTESNYHQYLKVKLCFAETRTGRDVYFEIYPVQGGHFNNVTLTLRIQQPNTNGLNTFVHDNHDEITIEDDVRDDGWTFTYCYFNKIVLPSNGYYTTSKAEYSILISMLFKESEFHTRVMKISGTFVPD